MAPAHTLVRYTPRRRLMPKRCCLQCRIVFEGGGSRCPRCEREWQQARNARRPHYRNPEYVKASALVRATATECWICKQGPRVDDPWQADHVSPTELRPAHRSCNGSRGQTHPVFRKAGSDGR